LLAWQSLYNRTSSSYQKVGAIVKFRTLIYQWMDMKCSQTYGLIGKTLPKAGEVAS
jgi:hypothetical protein